MAYSSENIPSHQSETTLLGLQPKATWESSRQIGQSWDERIRDQALFSARTTSKSYLDMVRKTLAAISSRQVIPSVAEEHLRNTLQNLGYNPATGFPDNDGRVPPATPGSITDLSSSRRIQLIVDTNIKQARSMAQLASSENPVFLMTNPAWRLTRTGARKKPRGDWQARWMAAGNSVGWQGAAKSQMVALKTSPIWKAIGDGAGGYTDTIASAFPPFAFGSGLAWVNVGRREWKRICEAEGIDDGMTNLKAQAVESQKVKEREAAKYEPSTKSLDRANEGIYRALSKAELVANGIANGLKRIERRKRDMAAFLDDAELYEAGDEVGKIEKELGEALQSMNRIKEQLATYKGNLAKFTQPKDAKQQIAYDQKLQQIAEASWKAQGIVDEAGKTADAKIAAAIAICRGEAVKA